ncbi:MAG: sulfite exporter TauE/SafE family protein [Candidatus Magnetoovum sp. WYHC-5]|nr:sulfite exporter TauE/SafE family protein [Candidatus Magnetoovum sp. WYHC-5]
MKKNIIVSIIILGVILCIQSSAYANVYINHSVVANTFDVITLIIAGVFVGVIGTLIGAGGGFLVVPFLIINYGFSPQHAVGTSMAVVFLNALSGTFSYVSQKRVDYELGIKFSVFALPGVIIGTIIEQYITVMMFSVIFSVLLLSIAYLLLFQKEFYLICDNNTKSLTCRTLVDAHGNEYNFCPDMNIGFGGSFFIGIISSLFGIGGGLIHVPLMTFIGVPVHVATATSHFTIVITSFIGLIIYMGLNTVDINYAIFIGIGSIYGAYVGAKLATITKEKVIKQIIAVALIIVAIKLVFNII